MVLRRFGSAVIGAARHVAATPVRPRVTGATQGVVSAVGARRAAGLGSAKGAVGGVRLGDSGL